MNKLQKRDFVSSPYRSEREKIISIQSWNVRKFFKLIDKLEEFLTNDRCFRLADNYLLAMVFTYFLRASLEPEEYIKDNFFAALFLAYNMEEDEGEFLLVELEYWLECSIRTLKQLRYELFQRTDYRGAVSRSCCEIVMRAAKPEHKIWQRRRHSYHSGIVSRKIVYERLEDICPICGGDSEEESDMEIEK